jgi:hypothetical protein
MDAIFVIPTLISPSIPKNMVPSICKLVERNILNNYYSVMRKAVELYVMANKSEFLENANILEGWDSGYMNDKDREDYKKQVQAALDAKKNANSRKVDADQKRDKELLGSRDPITGRMIPPSAQEEKNIHIKHDKVINKLDEVIKDADKRIKDMNTTLSQYKDMLEKSKKDDPKPVTPEEKKPGLLGNLANDTIDATLKKIKDLQASLDDKIERKKDDKKPSVIAKDQDYQKPFRSGLDDPEGSRDIQMFDTISIEPTVAVFKLGLTTKSGSEIDRSFKIGLKCVPYEITGDIKNLVGYMDKVVRNKVLYNIIVRKTIGVFNKVKKSIIFFKPWRMSKGSSRYGKEPKKEIVYSLHVSDIRKATKLSKKLRGPSSNAIWTSLLVLDANDLQSVDNDTLIFKDFKKLTDLGWGDMMVLDAESEVITSCSLSLLQCTTYPIGYLKKILNIRDIIDFSEINRSSKLFSISPIRSFLTKVIKK